MSGAPYGGCADLMGDQLIPNQVLGSEYIILKGYLNGPDKIYVVAIQNNTQITADGTVVGTGVGTGWFSGIERDGRQGSPAVGETRPTLLS